MQAQAIPRNRILDRCIGTYPITREGNYGADFIRLLEKRAVEGPTAI